jgi:predicted lipoprotein with Yx(FWY)xxD motif
METNMKRAALLTAAVLLFAVLAVQADAGRSVASSSRALVKTAYNKRLKTRILVDGAGRTLYMFTTDLNGKDTVCTPQGPYGAECPQIWPALTSAGRPRAGKGAKASLLSVYTRSDGKHQVRYNRHPLFYFHGDASTPPGDKKPGDAHGQGYVSEWYVLSPKGNPIRK